MLGILSRYPLKEQGHNSSASLHQIAEAARRSFADRNRLLGDPDAQSLPLARLRSAAHIDGLAASIDLERATPQTVVQTITITKK